MHRLPLSRTRKRETERGSEQMCITNAGKLSHMHKNLLCCGESCSLITEPRVEKLGVARAEGLGFIGV